MHDAESDNGRTSSLWGRNWRWFFPESSSDNGQVKRLTYALEAFLFVSGLKLNFQKSALIGVNVEEAWRSGWLSS